MWRSTERGHPAARALGTVLVASFVLTVASFLASIAVLSAKARGIGVAAETVASSASPAIDHLSRMRTALRHAEVLLDDYTDRLAAGEPPRVYAQRDIETQLAALTADWNEYTTLPSYPGEPGLWPAVIPSLAAIQQSAAAVLARLGTGDGRGAAAILDAETKPAVDGLDQKLDAVVSYKVVQGATLARRIMVIRQSVRRLSMILGLLCATLGGIAAVAAVSVVRQYARLMELRVSELEHFAGRVAHDIRSPLTSAALALDLAQRNPALDDKVRTTLARGTRTLERIGQIVDGLLVFARAGATPATGAIADVPRGVKDVLEDLSPSADEKGIELTAGRLDVHQVASSPGVLISILSNLVGNAIKYMGESPVRRIEIRARPAREMAHIEVQDSGPGIPEDMRMKVFEPYVRAAQSSVPGLGLGLATVRRLVEAHGGTVGVESSVGQGSLFWVELPLVTPRERTGPSSTAPR
jgi:signal transduction histidine kinase